MPCPARTWQGAILELRHEEGLGNAECAALLGIGEKAASLRYVRALQRLRPPEGRLRTRSRMIAKMRLEGKINMNLLKFAMDFRAQIR